MRQIHVEIAKKLMKEIQLDNNMMDKYRFEYKDKIPVEIEYPPKHVLAIGQAVEKFTENNLNVRITDEFYEEIACGEEGAAQEKYGNLVGYAELEKALNNYFNND